jgi:hypothetical protein
MSHSLTTEIKPGVVPLYHDTDADALPTRNNPITRKIKKSERRFT